jgi:hypothetical protein
MTLVTLIYLTVAAWLMAHRVAALPYLKFLIPPSNDEVTSLLRPSVDSLDSEFETLMNEMLSSDIDRTDYPIRFSKVSPSHAQHVEGMYQDTEAPSVSLFQQSWRYEDYIKDWYDDDEDEDANEMDFYSET